VIGFVVVDVETVRVELAVPPADKVTEAGLNARLNPTPIVATTVLEEPSMTDIVLGPVLAT
jgi:hypothetical protein